MFVYYSSPRPPQSSSHLNEEKKKPRPKDVFGRPLPTEEEFEVLKNAPRYVDWCYFVWFVFILMSDLCVFSSYRMTCLLILSQ